MLKINLSRKCILFITSTILYSDLSYFIHSFLMNLSLGSAQCRSISDRTMRKKFQFELKFNQASCLEYAIVKTIGFFVSYLGSMLSCKDIGLFMFIQNLHSLLSHQANCIWLIKSRKFWS